MGFFWGLAAFDNGVIGPIFGLIITVSLFLSLLYEYLWSKVLR